MGKRNQWARCTLGEIAKLKNGYAFKSQEYQNEGIPILRISDINDGIVQIENTKFIYQDVEFDKYTVKTGDILIAMSGATTGKFGIYNSTSKAYQNQRVGNLKPVSDSVVNKRFLYYLLHSLKRRIEKDAYGGAQPNISSSKVEEIKIELPPLNEQHRIVAKIEALFSELDNGIANLKAAQQQLKTYRQALLKHAFEGKLTAEWRAQNTDKLESAETLLDRIAQARTQRYQAQLNAWQASKKAGIKQNSKPKAPKTLAPLTAAELAELPELPEGWGYVYLAELGDLGRGKSKHRPRNDPKLFGGSYPFIQTGNVKASAKFITEYTQTYSDFGLSQSKLWPKDTLCITIAANIAETAFLGFDGCFPDSIVGFTAFKNQVFAEYVDFFIQAVRSRVEAYAPATAQKNINLETLENLVVPICSLDEQTKLKEKLEEKFSEIDQLEQTITTALQQADALRQSILKKAFSGQLVPQDPNDEPASALLARIKAEG